MRELENDWPEPNVESDPGLGCLLLILGVGLTGLIVWLVIALL